MSNLMWKAGAAEYAAFPLRDFTRSVSPLKYKRECGRYLLVSNRQPGDSKTDMAVRIAVDREQVYACGMTSRD